MIYDTADNRIVSTGFALSSAETATFNIKIACNTGYSLASEPFDDVTVEAKHSAAGGYTNLETTPISLTSWDGTTETFNIRLTAATISTPLRKVIPLQVGIIKPPEAPFGLTFTDAGGGTFTVSWGKPSGMAIVGYQSRVDAGAASATFTGLSKQFVLSPSTSYDIEIRAINANGQTSGWSLLEVTTGA